MPNKCSIIAQSEVKFQWPKIYRVTFSGYLKRYIQTKDRCFDIKMSKRCRKSDQPIHSYLTDCSYLQELGQLYS